MMEYVEWVLEHLVFPFPATYLLTSYWLEGKGLEPAEINKQLTKILPVLLWMTLAKKT